MDTVPDIPDGPHDEYAQSEPQQPPRSLSLGVVLRLYDLGVKSWLVAALVAVALVAGCAPGAQTRGSESKEALVDAYLTALQAGDSNAMLSLVSPRVEARAEVADAIRKNGSRQLKDVTVSYLDEFGGVYIVATVNGTNAGDGSRLQVTIPMSSDNGRYYLALGQAAPTGNEAGIGSPSATAA
jgi:hypothetical protein